MDPTPPIKWARRKWPYLPADVYIMWMESPSPVIKFPFGIELSTEDVYGVRMGAAFNPKTGRVVLVVDETDKDLIYDCYG